MLSRSVSPIVYFSSKDIASYEDEYTLKKNIDLPLGVNADLTMYKDTLENFLGIPQILASEFPLDYGILFMGIEYRFAETKQNR
jgi:hypothetical protein